MIGEKLEQLANLRAQTPSSNDPDEEAEGTFARQFKRQRTRELTPEFPRKARRNSFEREGIVIRDQTGVRLGIERIAAIGKNSKSVHLERSEYQIPKKACPTSAPKELAM